MNDLIQQPAIWWLGIGFLWLIVEMLTGTLFFFCISIGAFLVALLTWVLGLSGMAQVLLFAVAAIVAVMAWKKFRPNPNDKIEQRAGAEGLNNRLSGFIGREAVLDKALENGHGRIRLDDSYWTVTGADAPVGTPVRVVSVQGMILRVELV
jgi:membrane protein implicated in regulation of membrane protease activity